MTSLPPRDFAVQRQSALTLARVRPPRHGQPAGQGDRGGLQPAAARLAQQHDGRRGRPRDRPAHLAIGGSGWRPRGHRQRRRDLDRGVGRQVPPRGDGGGPAGPRDRHRRLGVVEAYRCPERDPQARSVGRHDKAGGAQLRRIAGRGRDEQHREAHQREAVPQGGQQAEAVERRIVPVVERSEQASRVAGERGQPVVVDGDLFEVRPGGISGIALVRDPLHDPGQRERRAERCGQVVHRVDGGQVEQLAREAGDQRCDLSWLDPGQRRAARADHVGQRADRAQHAGGVPQYGRACGDRGGGGVADQRGPQRLDRRGQRVRGVDRGTPGGSDDGVGEQLGREGYAQPRQRIQHGLVAQLVGERAQPGSEGGR